MKQIPLSKGRAFATASNDDYNYLMQWKWNFAASNGYALRYFNEDDKRGTVYMHRVVMTRILGKPIPRGYQVDHIQVGEASRLDNRRANLRLCTRSQNQWHKNKPKNNTSGFKGVSYNNGKYDAYIKVHRQRIYLGRYVDPRDAALMYDAASRLLHGEFSQPNLPDVPTSDTVAQALRAILTKRGIDI